MTPEQQRDFEEWMKKPGHPWEGEPDQLEFQAHGFQCFVVRMPEMGHLCGYVAVPSGNPFYGLGYDDDRTRNLECHGGLTYARQGLMDLTKDWVLGFDTAHLGDHMPSMQWLRETIPDWPKMPGCMDEGTYKNMVYVHEQVTELARQLMEKTNERKDRESYEKVLRN